MNINNVVEPVKKLWNDKPKAILCVIGVTVFTWILLYLGFLPFYSTSPMEEKLAYLFPIWIFLGLVGYAYLNYRVQNYDFQEKPKIE